MKVTLLQVLACALFLGAAPSAEAGRVKGIKGGVAAQATTTSASASTRALKEEKAKKTKAVKGPTSRSCTSSSSAKEVKFECRTRSFDVKASSADSADKEAKSKGDKGEAAATTTSTSLVEPTSRGISLTPDQNIRDKIKYKIKTNDQGIKVKIEYETEVATEQGRSETETEFELVFDRIIEYAKAAAQDGSDSDGEASEAYDWEADEVVQTVALENWADITQVSTDASQNVSFFTATTTLPSESGMAAPGSILFNFTISQADVSEKITANSMKIDVRILNFPWVRQDSYVALLSAVKSKKRIKLDYNKNGTIGGGKAHVTQDLAVSFVDDGMEEEGISAFGQYTWESKAQVTSDEFSGVVSNGNTMTSRQGDSPVEIDEDAVEEPMVAAGTVEEIGAVEEPFAGTAEEMSESGFFSGVEVSGNGTYSKPDDEVIDATSGTTIQVIATYQADNETDNFQNIAYSFVGRGAHSASDIYWDPQAGVGYEEPLESGACSIGLVVSSLMGAMLYLLVW